MTRFPTQPGMTGETGRGAAEGGEWRAKREEVRPKG